jgi:hypothetical protein
MAIGAADQGRPSTIITWMPPKVEGLGFVLPSQPDSSTVDTVTGLAAAARMREA